MGPLYVAAGAAEVAPLAAGPSNLSLKEWRKAQAQALLAGCAAVLGEDDAGRPELIVSRWATTRAFVAVEEFDLWLRRATGTGAWTSPTSIECVL